VTLTNNIQKPYERENAKGRGESATIVDDHVVDGRRKTEVSQVKTNANTFLMQCRDNSL
jgi:hypothetical protein